jgi:hypothetical protein
MMEKKYVFLLLFLVSCASAISHKVRTTYSALKNIELKSIKKDALPVLAGNLFEQHPLTLGTIIISIIIALT